MADGKIGKELSPLQMRQNLIAAFKGRAGGRDGDFTEKEVQALNYIATKMTDAQVKSIMGDSKFTSAEYEQIIKDAGQVFVTNQEYSQENADVFVSNLNQAAADASAVGVLHDAKVRAQQSVGTNNGDKKQDGAPKSERNIFERAWDFAKRNPVETAVGVGMLAGAAYLAFTPGGQAFAGKLASSALGLFGKSVSAVAGSKVLSGLVGVGGVATFLSCKGDDAPESKPTTQIIQTVNITITGNEDMPLLLDYIATLTAEMKNTNQNLDDLKSQLKQVLNLIAKLIANGESSAAEIIKLCEGNNALLDVVVSLLVENNELLKKNNSLIEEFMVKNGNDNKKILEAIEVLQKSVDKLEVAIKKLPAGIAMYLSGPLKAIYDAIKSGNKTSQEIKALIADLTKQMQVLINEGDTNNKQNAEIIGILESFSGILQNIEEGGMTAIDQLDAIVSILGTISADVKNIKNNIANVFSDHEKIAALLEQIIQNTEENNDLTKTSNIILTKIQTAVDKLRGSLDQLSYTQQKYFEKLLEAIGRNGTNLDAILQMLDDLNTNVEISNEQQRTAVDKILAAMADLDFNVVSGMGEVIGLAAEHSEQLNTIIGMLGKTQMLQSYYGETGIAIMNQIMALLGKLGNDAVDKINEVVVAIASKKVTIDTEDLKKILEQINANVEANGAQAHDDAMATLDAILNNTAAVQENTEVLKRIEEKLDKLAAYLKDGFGQFKAGYEALLKAIQNNNVDLNKLENLVEKLLKAAEKGVVIQQNILEKLSKLDVNMIDGFTALFEAVQNNHVDLTKLETLVDKLVTASNKSIAIQQDILEKISKLGPDMIEGFNAILEAINKNGTIGEGLATLLNEVLAKMDKMNATNKQGFKDVIEAIKGISVTGGTPDLSKIEALLTEVRDLSKENGVKLDLLGEQNKTIITILDSFKTELNNKLDVVNGKLDGLDANQKEIIAYLKKLNNGVDTIITKLTNKEEKDGVNFDKLMAKLQEILEAIQDHEVKVDVTGQVICQCNCGGGHNEGIIGELQDLIL